MCRRSGPRTTVTALGGVIRGTTGTTIGSSSNDVHDSMVARSSTSELRPRGDDIHGCWRVRPAMAVVGCRADVADPVPDTDSVIGAGCSQLVTMSSIATNDHGVRVGSNSSVDVRTPPRNAGHRPGARCSTSTTTGSRSTHACQHLRYSGTSPRTPPHVDPRPPWAFGS
jgi:hypothetical protein